uniref:Uncharacterized protein n=1 Tax=Pseudomonas phage PaBG TaxID=1335230 RepID=S5WKJ1_9CAUD
MSGDLQHAVDLLNEAVALDPKLWSLFDVMVPTATVVGLSTPIELMQVNDRLAMANVLGVLNGLLAPSANERISIIVENKNGHTQRKFCVTGLEHSAVGDAQHQDVEGSV